MALRKVALRTTPRYRATAVTLLQPIMGSHLNNSTHGTLPVSLLSLQALFTDIVRNHLTNDQLVMIVPIFGSSIRTVWPPDLT
jgi:hypothetical protein